MGRYIYVAKAGVATACTSTTGVGASGCELQIYNFNNGAATAITYVGGVDESGAIGTGGGNGTSAVDFNNITLAGKYAYISTAGSASACANGGTNATGCELQAYDISNPTSPTYLVGSDSSGVQGGGTSVGFDQTVLAGRYLYVAKTGSATDCNTSNNASGCEVQAWDTSGADTISINTGSTYTGTIVVDNTGVFNQSISVAGGATIGQGLQVTGDLGVTNNTASGTLASLTNNTASFTGTGLSITTNGQTSGTGLSIGSSSTGQTGSSLVVTTASTGAPTNGLVFFNFNGIRTAAGTAFCRSQISLPP